MQHCRTMILLTSTVCCILCTTLIRAEVLISNLPGNDGDSTFINALNGTIGSLDSKAAGFLMPATDYALISLVLRLDIQDPLNDPVVEIYYDVAGQPNGPLHSVRGKTYSYWIVVWNASTGTDSFLVSE